MLARLGHSIEAEHLHGLSRKCLRDAVAEEVVHRPNAPPVGAGDDRVADVEVSAGNENSDHGAPPGI